MIFKELAKKGHEVTMISPFPLKKPVPNYKDIFIPELLADQTAMEEMFEEFLKNPQILSFEGIQMMDNETKYFSEMVFQNKDFQNLVNSGEKFDLVVLDLFYNDAHLVLGHLFDAPIISISTAGTNELVARATGNPMPYAYVPNKFLPFSDEMKFFERLFNAVVNFLIDFYQMGSTGHEEMIRKYYPDAPSMYELRRKVALVFSNSHFSYETPRPNVPNIINLGGCHVRPPAELPADLKKILDDAKEGVIYFSLGSNVKSSFLKKDDLNNILTAFSKTKMKVLMKWEKEELPNKPSNVIISKWFPQNDILAHPNVKLFISHGGLMSTIETIYHGVPIIGMPVYADQLQNIPLAVQAGYALQVDFFNVIEKELSDAITEITTNPKYTENIKYRSELLRNQPIKPMDLAIYWVENVIKHKGAPHMSTKAHKLSWYQLMLLDVFAFIGSIVFIVGYVFYRIIKKLCSYCRKGQCKNKNKVTKGKISSMKKKV